MLIPRRVKHRKQHHPRQRGIASGGTSVSFGDYGIQALEDAYRSYGELNHVDSPQSQAPQATPPAPARDCQRRHVGELRRLRHPGAGARLRHQPADRVRSYRHQPAHQAWRQGVDQHLPGPSADQEARRNPYGFRKGIAGMVDRQRQAGTHPLRAELPQRADRPGGADPRHPQAADQGTHRYPRGSVLMAVGISPGELAELTDDELIEKLRESKEELFNLRFQMATGQMSNNRRLRVVRHEIARIYTVLRERERGLASGPNGAENGES